MKFLRLPVLTLLLAAFVPLIMAAPPEKKAGSTTTEKPLSPEEAKDAAMKRIEAFGWTRVGKGKLGTVAEIAIPQGYRFTGKSGSKQMMELFGNIPNESQMGFVSPENFDWSVIFSFEESGYVKDSDKDQLDADALFKQLKSNEGAANDYRAEKGLGKLFLEGWAMKPRYNETTHNLEWAIKIRDESGGISINYRTKLLGRRGVMNALLLVSPEELNSTLPAYQKLLTGFGFTQGQTYAEYRQGDKVAEYGLAGLVTAGVGFGLMKSGWLAKFGILFAKAGKLAWVAVVAALAGLKKLFMRLFGKNEE